MSLFRHPHLIQGIVHTAKGSFAINRGLVDTPDEVGESNGWLRLESEDQHGGPVVLSTTRGTGLAGLVTLRRRQLIR